MELTEAIESMARILHEERQRPTIGYVDNRSDLVANLQGRPLVNTAVLEEPRYKRLNITAMREQKTRLVSEKPNLYSFGGSNYETMLLLFEQVNKADRGEFIEKLLTFVESGGFCTGTAGHHFPKFQGYVSDLPLVAEFCIRNGYTERLFTATAKAKVPTPGLALMLMQLEETIALNFTLFGKQELKDIQTWLAPLREMADLQTHSARGSAGKMVKNPQYKSGREREANQIVDSIDRITAECNQAILLYIKGALQQAREPRGRKRQGEGRRISEKPRVRSSIAASPLIRRRRNFEMTQPALNSRLA